MSASVNMPDKPADDLLVGAEAIAEFLFGDERRRRYVYHLAETSRLPIFRLGASSAPGAASLLNGSGGNK